MPTAIVTIHGRRAKLTGSTREEVQAKIDELTSDTKTQEQEPTQAEAPKKQASAMDLLKLLTQGQLGQAETGGRNIAKAIEGATFGALQTPEPKELVNEGLPSQSYQENIADPASELTGAMMGAPASVGRGVAQATGKALGKGALGRLATGVATGATLGALETPDTGALDIEQRAKQAVTGGLTGGAMQGVAEGAKVAGKLTQGLSAKFINSLVKPRKTQLRYGANPGRTVAKKGITGINLDDFAENVAKEKDNVGNSIRQTISELPQKPADFKILEPIDEAINKLDTSKRTNKALIARLQDVKDDLLQIDDNGMAQVDLKNLTPVQAFDLKQQIADLTKFTGAMSDDSKVNNALRKAYGKAATGLKKVAPELETLNEEYSDLITAHKAVQDRIANVSGQNMIGLNQQIGGVGLGGVALGQTGDLIQGLLAYGSGLALQKAMASTAFKTNMAKGLQKMTSNQINNSVQSLMKQNPEIGNQIRTAIQSGVIKLTKEKKEDFLNASS